MKGKVKCATPHKEHWCIGWVLISTSQAMSPRVDKPLKSVMHGQQQGIINELYCLVTEVCANNLPTTVSARPGVEPAITESQVQWPKHYTTRPHERRISNTIHYTMQNKCNMETNLAFQTKCLTLQKCALEPMESQQLLACSQQATGDLWQCKQK